MRAWSRRTRVQVIRDLMRGREFVEHRYSYFANNCDDSEAFLDDAPHGRWIPQPETRWWHHWSGDGSPIGPNAEASAVRITGPVERLVASDPPGERHRTGVTFLGRGTILTTKGAVPSARFDVVFCKPKVASICVPPSPKQIERRRLYRAACAAPMLVTTRSP